MLYSDPVTQGDDDSTVWRKLCFALQNGGEAPFNLTAPQLSDATPDEGASVSVSDGTWSGDPTSFTYQWYLDGVLQGETSNTFSIPASTGGQEVYAVVTAHNATGSTSAQSDVGTVQTVDPLAGISYRLRFETTWDGTTFRPMWQDVARTTLVTEEGNMVATMGPADAEFVPNQANDTMQGIILLSVDGTPYIDTDGSDDNYPIGSSGDQVTYTSLLRSKSASFNNYYAPLESSEEPSVTWITGRWGPFSSGTTQFLNDPFPVSVRLNGVDLVSPFDLGNIEEWMVITVVSHAPDTPESDPRALFQLNNQFFGSCECIACFMYSGSPSSSDRDVVEAFYETLKPTP